MFLLSLLQTEVPQWHVMEAERGFDRSEPSEAEVERLAITQSFLILKDVNRIFPSGSRPIGIIRPVIWVAL